MEISICHSCGTRVVRTPDGLCPSCRQPLNPAWTPSQTSNPFGVPASQQAVVPPLETSVNPYASSTILDDGQKGTGNPLLIPAIFLLVGSILWFCMVLWVSGLQIFLRGPANREPAEFAGAVSACVLMLLLPVLTIAGAIAMINLTSRKAAWIGAIVCLIPICGPCYGLLFPFAIWAMVLLRSNVRERFQR